MSSRSNTGSSRWSNSAGSTWEIDYCVRTMNYLISTLGLSITPLRTLDDLTVEQLLRIHCALHGIDFASDFIPSGSAKKDVARMILSLKGKYGADKFNGEGKQVKAKHYEAKYGNHLSVYRDSESDISGADSFYVLPHQNRLAAEETQETMDHDSSLEPIVEESDATGDTFETIENIVINVENESTTDEDQLDADVSGTSTSVNDTMPNQAEVTTSQTSPHSISSQQDNATAPINKQLRTPLTSSPVKPDQKLSKSHLSTNVSVIKKSQSTVSNLQRTLNSTNPNNSKSRSQSTPRNIPSSTSKSYHTNKNNSQPAEKKSIQVLAKNDKFGRRPFSGLPPLTQQKHPQRTNETKFMSDSDIDDCIKDRGIDNLSNLTQLRELQAKIRGQISESVLSLDDEISKLKRKQPPKQPKAKAKHCAGQTKPYFPTNISSLRWLLPVDARFPSYHKGVIIPKCTSWRSNLKRPTTRQTKTSLHDKCRDLATRKYSTLAERGSEISEKQLELSEDDSTDD